MVVLGADAKGVPSKLIAMHNSYDGEKAGMTRLAEAGKDVLGLVIIINLESAIHELIGML